MLHAQLATEDAFCSRRKGGREPDVATVDRDGAVTDDEGLLPGPRGRQVCCLLLGDIPGTRWTGLPGSRAARAPERLAEELRAAVARCNLDWLAEAAPTTTFLGALNEAVSSAVYWQEPYSGEDLLADGRVTAALRRVADAIAGAPGARWWASPMDPCAQHEVIFDEAPADETSLAPGDSHAALVRWRADTGEYERSAVERPTDPAANWSGRWWSAPALSGLINSTRALGAGGPVGLSLVEDSMGWTAAHCRPRRPRPGVSVFEIGRPEDWAELVRRYPLAVTRSRRHDWWRATGEDVEWAIPDYLAVAEDYDGVHLSVEGYLSTAGRALPAGDASTVLAGWDPDQTWWLTDATDPAGPLTRWTPESSQEPFGWTATIG